MAANVEIHFNGDAAKGAIRAGAARGLLLAAEHVLTESQAVVPLDEGELQRSGTTAVDEGKLKAAVGYDSPYAARQHEELTWRHAPGRQAKFLEQPLNASRLAVSQLLAAQIRRALR
jgi:hypothetical protein